MIRGNDSVSYEKSKRLEVFSESILVKRNFARLINVLTAKSRDSSFINIPNSTFTIVNTGKSSNVRQ